MEQFFILIEALALLIPLLLFIFRSKNKAISRISTGIITALVLILCSTIGVLAAYSVNIMVINSSTTDYTMLPINAPLDTAGLISGGYITNAAALDVAVKQGATSMPHMMVDDKVMFSSAIPDNSVSQFVLSTANAPLTDYYIIPGLTGYVTTPDHADLEPGDEFTFTISGYFNTETPEVGETLIYKEDAVKLSVVTTGHLKFEILGASPTEITIDCPSGYHILTITCDGVNIGIGFTDNTLNDDAAISTVDLATGAGGYTWEYGDPYKRNLFYANGRWWAFMADGTATDTYGWRSSADGITWSAWTEAQHVHASAGLLDRFAWAFDGAYVHYALTGWYRMGTPNADGTITWASAPVATAVFSNPRDIAFDTDGYPYVLYLLAGVDPKFYMAKSSTKDGTWTTAFNTLLGSHAGSGYYGDLCKLPDGHMLAVYGMSGANKSLYAREWKGSITGMGAEETLVNASYTYGGSAASDSNGKVYFTWIEQTTNNIKGKIRNADATLGTAVTLQAGATATTNARIGYLQDMSRVYVFWANSPVANKIYYTSCDTLTGTWDTTPVTWQSEDYTVLTTFITTLAKSRNGKLGVLWVLDKVTDELRFSWLQVDTPSDEVALVAAVPDNANNWRFLDGNIMRYSDYFKFQVAGVEQIWYQPTSYIVGDTLPNIDGATGTGTFVWGTNPVGITLSMTSSGGNTGITYTPVPTPPSKVGDPVVPVGVTGGSLLGSDSAMAGVANPFYPFIHLIAENGFNNNDAIVWAIALSIIGAALAGLAALFTRRAIICATLFTAMIVIGKVANLVPLGYPIVCAIMTIEIGVIEAKQ